MNRLKHWQLFVIAFVPFFISLRVDNEYYSGLIKSLSVLFVVIYYLTIGEHLKETKGTSIVNGHTFFRFNCIYMLFLTIVINAASAELFRGDIIIVIVLLAYFLIAFIQTVDHLALLLRQAENKESHNYKQKGEFILFFIWPIGVWILQPRINKIS